jgi:hypothetical protein
VDTNNATITGEPDAGSSNVASDKNEAIDDRDKESEEVLRAKEELASWVKDAPRVCCNILNSDSMEISEAVTHDKGNGDGDSEALTVVLCSFLLDLCHRYPENRSEIVSQVLELLRIRISEKSMQQTNDHGALEKAEPSLAALCHAAVLFTRALPKTRILVLQKGLVHSLVSCIHSFVRMQVQQDSARPFIWPMWLAPSLLLLDIMAQPVVAFSDGELIKAMIEGGDLSLSEVHDEFKQVRDEHKAQAAGLSDMANNIFSAISDGKKISPKLEEPAADKEDIVGAPADEGKEQADSSMSMSVEVDPKEKDSPFASVPAYFPLLPMDSVEACLDICLSLLGNNEANKGKVAPPPGITHATLLLMLRLLRTPKVSSRAAQRVQVHWKHWPCDTYF